MMKIMKLKTTFLRQPLFALGIGLLSIHSSVALTNEVNPSSDNPGVAMVQASVHEVDTKDKNARGNDDSLLSEHRMRLQTINNVVRTQQTLQRVSLPRR